MLNRNEMIFATNENGKKKLWKQIEIVEKDRNFRLKEK